ncbi:MAG: replication-associated recombination protein A [Alphaproteobacteria bacterium]|nr:replication-associated recombination protein A [Alphaproteobacteria bacterium]
MPKNFEPLAHRLRPQILDHIFGQEHLTGEKGLLRQMVQAQKLPSLILWGPPGCGKTTLAHVIGKEIDADFIQISAVFAGVKDLREIFHRAKQNKNFQRKTILFIDEIHRFNKSQQDSLLPVIEDGTIILIGATTENPSFELNKAVLSRCRVCVLKRLTSKDLTNLLQSVEQTENKKIPLTDDAKESLIEMSDGDARYLLGSLEIIYSLTDKMLSKDDMLKILQQRASQGDKNGESHFNLISAIHKSLRGSDPQAALYWTARMINNGEDPRYLFRRLTRFASEDIGNADPHAMPLLVSAWQAYERIGQPEGEIHLAQAVIYLALAPKSNASYVAWENVKKFAEEKGSLAPPNIILNAPTKLMKDIGYGENYQYDHETKDGFSGQNYFPDTIKREIFYTPVERGFERDLKKRIDYFNKLREKK